MVNLKNIAKKIFVIILILVFIAAFSASYSSLNIDNLAFVVALGIDTSDTKSIKVTFQFVNPPSSTEGASGDSKIILDTVDATSITNAINTMNAYLAKKLDLSHCKTIVFSEEIAKNGLSEYIYSLMNDVQIRPTSNIIISKCTANAYIGQSAPSLETLVSKYYDTFPNSSKYTGYMPNATIGDFFNALVCNYCQPYAILGGTLSDNNDVSDNDISNLDENSGDSEIKSGSSTISGTRNSENIGTAVFKHDKLVGELNAIETICLLSLTNKVNSFLISIQNPEDETSLIDIYLTPDGKTKIDAQIVNSSPYIKVDANFTARIHSMNENSKYLDSNILNSISDKCSNYLESAISQFLYKTSLTYKSDITGIGKHVLYNFKTDQDFENYNWESNYTNSTFEININTNMESGFLLTQT